MITQDRTAAELPARRLRRTSFAWGFVDQACSSATNFGLSLLAGRVLGPSGLGAVYVAFSAYLLAVGLQRSLLTEPLVASSTTLPAEERRAATRSGLVLSLLSSAVAAAALAVIGFAIGGHLGHALLLLAPWLVPAVVQDFWRAVLFRDGRSVAATANDALWLAVMMACAPLAWEIDATWAVIGCWGAGAVAGTVLGFVQTRCGPASPPASARWWRAKLWPFGRWLGINTLVYSGLYYATLFALVGILGTTEMGGLAAGVTVFAPLSLIGAAIALPGLPAMAHSLAQSLGTARRFSAAISLGAVAVTALYVGVISLGAGRILGLVYGDEFRAYSHLVWPVGAGQVFAAATIGFMILLKARQSGRRLFIAGTAGTLAALVLATVLATTNGVVGAAWGLSFGAAVTAVLTIQFALRR